MKIADACAECRTPPLFDQAARIFDGWTDPDTGLRVLRIHVRGADENGEIWSTPYHQHNCFLDGGRKVLLRITRPAADREKPSALLLDLTNGRADFPFPPGWDVREVHDGTHLAALFSREADDARAMLWDLPSASEAASFSLPGWGIGWMIFLSDGRRAVVHFHRRSKGVPGQLDPPRGASTYGDPFDSRHYVVSPDEPPRLVLEADGFICNHIQGCPTDPELYAYDRWPTPKRDVDQVIHLHTVDGRFDEPLRLSPQALRPGNMFGVRDHYVWTPDGKRIVSYLCPQPIVVEPLKPEFNHFALEWWLSALDWRTGEDLCAKYPEGRWGGHMQISPDSRYIVCGGGPGFDKLFAVEIEGLSRGWNERILCSYPRTVSPGKNEDPFAYPFVLPDQSGVIFNAGWPGPEHGVYLVEWPAELRRKSALQKT